MRKLANRFLAWLGFASTKEIQKIAREAGRLRIEANKLHEEIGQIYKDIQHEQERQKLAEKQRAFPPSANISDEERKELKKKLENYPDALPTIGTDIYSPMRRYGPGDFLPHAKQITIDDPDGILTRPPLRDTLSDDNPEGAHALGDSEKVAQEGAQGDGGGQGEKER